MPPDHLYAAVDRFPAVRTLPSGRTDSIAGGSGRIRTKPVVMPDVRGRRRRLGARQRPLASVNGNAGPCPNPDAAAP